MSTQQRRTAALRAAVGNSNTIQVDPDAGVIRGVSLMSVGPALGHPFSIDNVTLSQLVTLANAQPEGVRVRFKHPKIDQRPDGSASVEDSTGTMVGRIKNARLDGQVARGDLYLGQYAKNLPALGNVFDYIVSVAQDDPTALGFSAFFSYDVEPQLDAMGQMLGAVARIQELDAIDVVDSPAANRHGMLSARQTPTFDPQPATPNSSGYSDPQPKDPARAPIPVSTPDDDQIRALNDDAFDLLSAVCSIAQKGQADAADYDDDDQEIIAGMSAEQREILDRAANGDTQIHAAVTRERLRRASAPGMAGTMRKLLYQMTPAQLAAVPDTLSSKRYRRMIHFEQARRGLTLTGA